MKLIEEPPPLPEGDELNLEMVCDGRFKNGCRAKFLVEADDWWLESTFGCVFFTCPLCGCEWHAVGEDVPYEAIQAHVRKRYAEKKAEGKRLRRLRVRGWFLGPVEEDDQWKS